jgi:hypothetical protein
VDLLDLEDPVDHRRLVDLLDLWNLLDLVDQLRHLCLDRLLDQLDLVVRHLLVLLVLRVWVVR